MTTVSVAVPRKGRPLGAVLERLADEASVAALADDVVSTLRYEKAVTKGSQSATGDVYERLATYSDDTDPHAPEYTLVRDDRQGMPRRTVFDSLTVPIDEGLDLRLVGREEPFRADRRVSVRRDERTGSGDDRATRRRRPLCPRSARSR